MTIAVKYSLMTAVLIGAVVAASTVIIMRGERAVLAAESRQRVDLLSAGAARIAQESLDNADRFMLATYLMSLSQAHPELALAEVTRGGHTSTIGRDGPGLVYRTQTVARRSRLSGPSVSPERLGLRLGFSKAMLDRDLDRAESEMARRTGVVAGVFIVLGIAGALALGRLLTAPVRDLTAAVEAVGGGKLDVSVAAHGRDEVGALARRFNEMTERLRELNRFREDVLHTLTHELNTPLSGLKGYLELWRDVAVPDDTSERQRALGTMTRAVDRMEGALGGALSLFRAEAPPVGSRKVVWLDDLVQDLCVLFEPSARAGGVELRGLPAPTGLFLYTDEDLVRQIATNLISNAIKYTPQGGQVRLALSADGERVAFSVSDTGYGIAPENLPQLFTKFYRIAGDERRRIAGTGLGLSIAYKAAKALGGDIAVESALRQGTTFTVTLPCRKPAARGRRAA